ncbi:hypothetical protein SprV_0200833300 [Sparganum proliferum]
MKVARREEPIRDRSQFASSPAEKEALRKEESGLIPISFYPASRCESGTSLPTETPGRAAYYNKNVEPIAGEFTEGDA